MYGNGVQTLFDRKAFIRANTGLKPVPLVREISREAAQSNYKWSSLVLGIVKSAPFQMKKAQGES